MDRTLNGTQALVTGLLWTAGVIGGTLIGLRKGHPVVGFIVGNAASAALSGIYLYATMDATIAAPNGPSGNPVVR